MNLTNRFRHTLNNIRVTSDIKAFGKFSYAIFTLFILITQTLIIFGQPVTQEWVARYDSPDHLSDAVSAMALDSSGNIIITGTIQTLTQNSNYCTVQYNSSGVLQWVTTYSGPPNANGIDAPTAIGVDQQGNVYVTGYSERSGFGTDDYCTIKYSPNGDSLWVRRYDGPAHSHDYGYSLALDNQSNVYVTGGSTTITGDSNICTIKYNTNGVQQWLIRFPGPGLEGDKVFVDGYHNVYVVGRQYINYNEIITTIKYSQPNGIKPISNEIPSHFSLSQNYPNPFNPITKITFNIPHPQPLSNQIGEGGRVVLTIYDILGREVATLVNGQHKPGMYEVTFDGSNFASGVYFYRLEIRDPETSSGLNFTQTRKMVIIK